MKSLIFSSLIVIIFQATGAFATETPLCFNDVALGAFEYLKPLVDNMDHQHLPDKASVAVTSVRSTGQSVIGGVGTDFFEVALSGHQTRESDGFIVGRLDWKVKVSTKIDTCHIKDINLVD